MKNILITILLFALYSCTPEMSTLKTGYWRATLEVQDQKKLPFVLEVKEDGTLVIQNGEERIIVDEVVVDGANIRIQTPVFEGYFEGVFNEDRTLITGDFIKPSLDRVVPFSMVYGEDFRFAASRTGGRENSTTLMSDVTGNWETVFSPDTPADLYIAKGMFKQDGNIVTGTFRTTTGDYRYLEGAMDGDQLQLSTFDGAHAFLFTATVTDSTLDGYFYSGNHWRENFRAKRNQNYELPETTALTYIKEGYDGVSFSFPDANGNMVSLADDRFKEKVTLVQILGSWCPNCLEETKFYVDYLKRNPEIDIEIVGLSFEYAKTEEKAFESIARLKDRLEVPYPILLAQYGTSDKKIANEKLPMLNHILSYPTTIYIDKKGEVRRIHTGYNGTATGDKHLEFKADFDQFIKELTAE